jgi:hypothetical protein
VALIGKTVAVSVSVPSIAKDVLDLLIVTLVTGTLAPFTVTLQTATRPPSVVVTVMVAVPAPWAVTTPVLLTVATPVAGIETIDHVTF